MRTTDARRANARSTKVRGMMAYYVLEVLVGPAVNPMSGVEPVVCMPADGAASLDVSEARSEMRPDGIADVGRAVYGAAVKVTL